MASEAITYRMLFTKLIHWQKLQVLFIPLSTQGPVPRL